MIIFKKNKRRQVLLEGFKKLVEVVSALRGPKGCPWDKEQTHESMKSYLLEETYEVIESIQHQDPEKLKEELGDLLLQIIFHARLAEEKGEFTLKDVIEHITEKLIRRHPHVFGNAHIETSEAQKKHWEKLKKEEGKTSALEGVPKTAPALFRAFRVQQKASVVGFDWGSKEPVWEKIKEEMEELEKALASNDIEKIQEEFGDLLFALVNFARFIKVHPEEALHLAIEKFIDRFQKVEEVFQKNGKRMEESTLEEMDLVWNAIKQEKS